MGWYEAIKDGIAVAQQADNVPLVRELIDAQKQILDLIEENQRLRAQVKELQETSDISEKIVRHEDAYITLKDDPQNLIYCSCCWDTQRILVQGQKLESGPTHVLLVGPMLTMIEMLPIDTSKKLLKR